VPRIFWPERTQTGIYNTLTLTNDESEHARITGAPHHIEFDKGPVSIDIRDHLANWRPRMVGDVLTAQVTEEKHILKLMP